MCLKLIIFTIQWNVDFRQGSNQGGDGYKKKTDYKNNLNFLLKHKRQKMDVSMYI